MRLAVLCLLLSGCGPVVLGEEEHAQATPPATAAGSKSDLSTASDAAAVRDPQPALSVAVRIKPLDCGRCFELQAEGSGGRPPYDFEWEDGTIRARRQVCVGDADLVVSVVARDAESARSASQAIQLQKAAAAACQQPTTPPAAVPPPRLCLWNTSFEGTPAANFGQEEAFDADPWSTCTNPAATNTPNIGNDSVAQTLGTIPQPTDGDTFLALGEGEQVSQAFCSPLAEDAPVSLELDLARLNIGAGIVPETEQVFLEIWGGLEVDCSLRELLWASPALQPGWHRYCVTLRPRAFMTQLTLRANSDLTLATPAHLLVDHMKPVDGCR